MKKTFLIRLKMQLIEKYIKNKKIIKTIYIKNRIINVIVN